MPKASIASTKKKSKTNWGVFLSILVLVLVVAGAIYYRNPLLNIVSSFTKTNQPSPPVSTPSTSSSGPKSADTNPTVSTVNANSSLSTSPVVIPGDTKGPAISQATDMAKSYAAMTPSKVAVIFETQSMDEIVYAMAMMSENERAKIWSKMTPSKVSDVSFLLKKKSEWSEKEIAQLKQKATSVKKKDQIKTSAEELALSYSQMPPASAAKLIDRMLQSDKNKTLSVVKAMDNKTRTKILTIMAEDTALMEAAAQIIKAIQ